VRRYGAPLSYATSGQVSRGFRFPRPNSSTRAGSPHGKSKRPGSTKKEEEPNGSFSKALRHRDGDSSQRDRTAQKRFGNSSQRLCWSA
jgi:hypothetical protein